MVNSQKVNQILIPLKNSSELKLHHLSNYDTPERSEGRIIFAKRNSLRMHIRVRENKII